MLEPSNRRDFAETFEAHFQGMASTPTTAAALLDVRAKLLQAIATRLDAAMCAFLESVEHEVSEFTLIGRAHAAALPGVRRKLVNLGQRSPEKRSADLERLSRLLARSALP